MKDGGGRKGVLWLGGESHPPPPLKFLKHQSILLIVHLPETLMKLSLQNTHQVICRGHGAKLQHGPISPSFLALSTPSFLHGPLSMELFTSKHT